LSFSREGKRRERKRKGKREICLPGRKKMWGMGSRKGGEGRIFLLLLRSQRVGRRGEIRGK